MSSNFSPHDEYGFLRPENFDYAEYEGFMSDYLGVLARRRQKWELLVKGDYRKLKKGAKLKRYVRKGIPGSHRKGVWLEVSGAAALRREEPELYMTMLDMKITNPVVEDQINTDLPRTFPNNIYFDSSNSSNYQRPMYNILKAFANNNPNIGYCQGLNYIAGLLYLITKDEDSSFWLLKVLCERILPDYYTQSMPGLLTDMKVLARLARQEVPAVANHIERLQMPWALFASKWFVCLYCEVLLVETVLRVWETVFYEGSEILFRVALGLLKLNQDRLLNKTDFASLAGELRLLEEDRITVSCHSFLDDICTKTGGLPRAEISRLREEVGREVRAEQAERERRRREEDTGIRDG